MEENRLQTSSQSTLTARHLGLHPPPDLNNAERMLCIDLVDTCSPRHLVKSDVPLLVSYVQATLMARSAVHDPAMIAIWEKAVRVQATLATRLRLALQARKDPKTVARQQAAWRSGPLPWEIDYAVGFIARLPVGPMQRR